MMRLVIYPFAYLAILSYWIVCGICGVLAVPAVLLEILLLFFIGLTERANDWAISFLDKK